MNSRTTQKLHYDDATKLPEMNLLLTYGLNSQTTRIIYRRIQILSMVISVLERYCDLSVATDAVVIQQANGWS